MTIQIKDIWADAGDDTRKNKFRTTPSAENVRIRYLMYVPKDIANNKVRVNHDLGIVGWGNNTVKFHKVFSFTYPPEAADKWWYHQVTLGPNPLGIAEGWMKFQVAADIDGRDDIAYSPENFIKFWYYIY